MRNKPPLWLMKLWQRWQLRKLNAEVHQISYTKPNRALCEKLWRLVDARAFAHYQPQRGALVHLEVVYPTVEDYIRQLRAVNSDLLHEQIVASKWGQLTSAMRTLDEFLTSADGHYLDYQQAVAKLQVEVLRLCELMQPADTESVGRHEHNLRILAKHLVSLRLLAVELVRASI